MSKPVFLEKQEKIIVLAAKNFTQHAMGQFCFRWMQFAEMLFLFQMYAVLLKCSF